MSGQDNPHKGLLQAQVTVTSSGQDNPHGNAMVAHGFMDPTAAAGVAPAQSTADGTVHLHQSVEVRVSIQKPEAFSVAITVPKSDKVQLDSIEVNIFDDDTVVFTSALISSPCTLDSSTEPHVFPLDGEQLEKALPHLRVGNIAEVKVVYSAENTATLTISIVGKKDHRSLGELVGQLFGKE